MTSRGCPSRTSPAPSPSSRCALPNCARCCSRSRRRRRAMRSAQSVEIRPRTDAAADASARLTEGAQESAPRAPAMPELRTSGASAIAAEPHDAAPQVSDEIRREIHYLLEQLVTRGASDLHLRVSEPPILRLHGEMSRIEGKAPLDNATLEAMMLALMPDRNRREYESINDTDFAYEIEGLARFRCNALRDRRGAAAVFRVIPARVITADELGLTEEVQRLCHLPRGLVLVTGPTGSGKSTTLCAPPCVKIRTSFSWASCATSRRCRSRSKRPKPDTSCSVRCTRRAP